MRKLEKGLVNSVKYHMDHKHLTEHCRELVTFLENLIKERKLQEYVAKDKQKPKKKKAEEKRARSPSPDSSESDGKGTTQSMSSLEAIRWEKEEVMPRKSCLLQHETKGKRPLQDDAMYFTKDDTKNVLKHHEDALVIEANIGPNNRVTKLMVDNGSSQISCT